MMTEDTYSVALEIFEGPMDLLVHLIQKNKVDIHDIPIAFITEQYLEYIEGMKAVNINIGGDFLVMAATLAYIKSKSLLPRHSETEDSEDPREEIARPLLEYLQMKAAAKNLSQRFLLNEDVFNRKPEKDFAFDNENEEVIEASFAELISAFEKILSAVPKEIMNLSRNSVSVKERISELADIFEEREQIDFEALFFSASSKSDLIVTFLAILEMAKLSIIKIIQNIQSGAITLCYL